MAIFVKLDGLPHEGTTASATKIMNEIIFLVSSSTWVYINTRPNNNNEKNIYTFKKKNKIKKIKKYDYYWRCLHKHI